MKGIKISVVSYVGLHPLPLDLIENMISSQSFPLNEVEFIFIEANSSTSYKRHFASKTLNCKVEVISGCKSRGHAHNQAIRKSKGEIIYFVADDFILPSTAIQAHWNHHQAQTQDEAVGISPGFIPKAIINDFSQWLESSGRLFGVPFTPDMNSLPKNFFYIGNTSIKRSFLEKAGFFEEYFEGESWDDYELGLRLSKLAMDTQFVEGANAIHFHNISEAVRFKEIEKAGRNAYVFKKSFPSKYEWEHHINVPTWEYLLNIVKAYLLFKLTNKQIYRYTLWEQLNNYYFKKGYFKA